MMAKPGHVMATILGTMLLCLSSVALRGSAKAQESTHSARAKQPVLSQDYFKNVQVLRGIPVDEFMGTMGFIAGATGMNCTDCHVEQSNDNWARYADDTELKHVARRMMLMVKAINETYFGGQRVLTCYSCHRGARIPKVIVNLTEQYSVPPPEDPDQVPDKVPGAPSIDQVLAKYVSAVGGEENVRKITSLVGKGTYQGYDDPQQFPLEIYVQAPDERTTIMHTPDGDNTTACNGNAAWTAAPLTDLPKAVMTLTGQNLDGIKLDAALAFPGQIKTSLSSWRVGPLTTINDQTVRIVQGTTASGAIVKLYFDPQSGLLVRQLRTANTPIGAIPTQVDYADYREVAGAKMPFRWTVTWTDGRTIFQLNQIQPNVSIPQSRFAEPAPSVPPSGKPLK